MTKRMLVDATHPEETRVAVVSGNWLSDFDFERASKQQLKGNIYLAKVIRIEPSLQAAFVEYGGNRHGFLPFAEIHPDYYRIPMADRPTEEEPGEDDAEEFAVPPEEIAAAAADVHAQHADDMHAHEHPHSDHIDEDLHSESIDPAPHTESYGLDSSVSDFGVAASDDLGLITDFGNAAIGDVSTAIVPTPVETVGGEMAENAISEERRHYPPRQRYKIQEVVKRRQVMLIQVVKEERGNKGAALTTFLSLAGRYCVLMPNTERGGGVSRKITSHQDRRRMKEMLDQLEVPDGMAVILRTAGMEQDPAEIQRDLEYLLRLWNGIREQTLKSTAPALVYEEANLIKRSMRDLFARDVSEVLVSGKQGYELARDFMRTIMPDEEEKVKLYTDTIPLFFRFNVEKQIDNLYTPTVQLRSGGYIVINPTEALVSIDVNSGKATRERHIEGTALKTNLEAAEEIARQLRLRDLAGLVVIDFIDMEDGRNNAAVERRLKEAMRFDRARLQIGRISPFGLLELSRQRLRPSLMEINFEKCVHCAGVGFVRSVDSAALSILRMIEEEGIKQGSSEMVLHLPTKIALYILNQKRPALNEIERRYGLQVLMHSDDALVPPDFKLERVRATNERPATGVNPEQYRAEAIPEFPPPLAESGLPLPSEHQGIESPPQENGGRDQGRRRGRFGFGRGRNRNQDRQPQQNQQQPYTPQSVQPVVPEIDGNIPEPPFVEGNDNIGNAGPVSHEGAPAYQGAPGGDAAQQDQQRRGRRRGRRGGRGRRSGGGDRPPREGGGESQPRDNNFRPRNEQRGDQRGGRDWNRNNNDRPQASFQPPATTIPVSIHDIDTTPRVQPSAPAYTPPPAAPRSYDTPATAPRPEKPRQPISSAPYEIVDHASDKPKGGWWKKLTGQ